MSRRPSLPGAAELFRATGGQPAADPAAGREAPDRSRDRLRSLQRDAHVVDFGAAVAAMPDPGIAEAQRPEVYPVPPPARGPIELTEPAPRSVAAAPMAPPSIVPTPIAAPAEPLPRPAVAPTYEEQPSAAARSRSTGVRQTRRQRVRTLADRRPTGRERHDEKITVYCSPEELFDLETARLSLRGEHGLVVDRGRIVREAVAVVLADLAAKGEDSILVRRLREF